MAGTQYIRQYRFVAPLGEKLEDELLNAVRKGYNDAEECVAELHRRGWKDEWIYGEEWVSGS